jgi:hypothetical protein
VTATSVSTSIDLTAGKTYYWRVKVQNSATLAVDVSGWSPTQVFFNRYQPLILGSPAYQRDTFDGWNPEPIHFFAGLSTTPATQAALLAALPANAYYQVELSNDGFTADSHLFTFTKTANIGTASARQLLNGLSGAYAWRIRIVNGNDNFATPITDWTNGNGQITP